jgi:Zn finger protein HypA/HybF involved in hydrogenase expression
MATQSMMDTEYIKKLAKNLPQTWYNKSLADCRCDWVSFQKPNVAIMSEDEAIQRLTNILETTPEVSAWITLELLQIALNLRWEKMTHLATQLLEQRQLWFSPSGFYAHLSETDAYYRNCCNDNKITMAASRGQWCTPKELLSTDECVSTMNIDHNLENWLNNTPIEKQKDLLELLSRALACTVAQWLVEETESFYREEQCKTIGVMHHINREPSEYKCNGENTVFWHTKFTSHLCPHCVNKEVYNYNEYRQKFTLYEQLIDRARIIRRTRVRGVFQCAIKILTMMYRIRNYKPGTGKMYLKAMEHFNKLLM